ncbi:MAG TPA: TIR domain-containing protein [Eubacteriales bacterium]|nr:TIR domain-containing protein [Eubacteriales bacterium]
MKVFISWSGERSNKIAETLKLWIKHVIQSVEPFVSSQDISKGARWSTDIAAELQDTHFGILCVTKDNFQQPWLLFEAGALSKTIDKTYVVPLLFDLEPSDLQDSPLLQFQATVYSKDEIKKLMVTLNTACENTALEPHELEETFEVWYPKLEESLGKIEPDEVEAKGKGKIKDTEKTLQILEEILELTRINQKLLRNPENATAESTETLLKRTERLMHRLETYDGIRARSLSPRLISKMVHTGLGELDDKFAFLVTLSLYKDSFPWIYEAGKDMIEILESKRAKEEKQRATIKFQSLIRYTMEMARSESQDIDSRVFEELYLYADRLCDGYIQLY